MDDRVRGLKPKIDGQSRAGSGAVVTTLVNGERIKKQYITTLKLRSVPNVTQVIVHFTSAGSRSPACGQDATAMTSGQ